MTNMTFEQYLKENTSYVKGYDIWLNDNEIKDVIKHAEHWHVQELKSIRAKGANTTNSKYSKEQRSEWARMGGKKRGDNSKNINNKVVK